MEKKKKTATFYCIKIKDWATQSAVRPLTRQDARGRPAAWVTQSLLGNTVAQEHVEESTGTQKRKQSDTILGSCKRTLERFREGTPGLSEHLVHVESHSPCGPGRRRAGAGWSPASGVLGATVREPVGGRGGGSPSQSRFQAWVPGCLSPHCPRRRKTETPGKHRARGRG